MKKIFVLLAMTASFAFILTACSNDPVTPVAATDKAADLRLSPRSLHKGGSVVVANRGSGTISVIDAKSAQLTGTFSLPQAENEAAPEPMYVVAVPAHQRLFVGDRANNRVVAFNARTFAVEGTVPAGNGVFHMWADGRGRQLWVNNDIDKTTTVIDPASLEVLASVPTPADLVGMGGKPHDVFLDHGGRNAYLTVLAVEGPNDYLVQFSTTGFNEVNRAPVGKDPHLSMGVNTDLYVPCQNSNQVLVFDPESLALVADLPVPGAHGASMARNGKFFYTTNLPGGGAGALYTIATSQNVLAAAPVDTPYPVPHNLVTIPNGKRLFVTHSGGTADKVTVYHLVGKNRRPEYLGEVTVGTNPFGIAFVN